ncbi:hypothetical protein JI435_426520 [Parastagonospora nodorum SN15]|uniref:Uncharacterized protein n=1 Tax=Phaeosphaeria nodorum (strain SN15 / ATCC MYA-4574 / FGSC 10173) TaxID=321614 RepID=A0A7U2ER75_PHANO|nr:hypothetical protein HBI66_037420 [Parastagonospora nodorum]QRC91132.1 hypothetical protein JI435_426520 [Parastagonospora nodorum SN15]
MSHAAFIAHCTEADCFSRTARHTTLHPSLWQSKLREVLWEQPKDVFVALRESRRVIIESMPPPAYAATDRYPITIRIYGLFYDFNVLNTSRPFNYTTPNSNLSGSAVTLDFATAEEAKIAIQTRTGG